jgi:copper chaperone CopZ
MKLFSLITGLIFSGVVMASKVEVEVAGMTCGMCVESITKELKNTKKAESIEVSLEKKMAFFSEVKGQKITDNEIKTAIKNAGYEAVKIIRK